MIRYSGNLGDFEYDENEYSIDTVATKDSITYIGATGKTVIPKGLKDANGLFIGFKGEMIDISGSDTSEITVFDEMFARCPNLKMIIGIETMNVASGKSFTLMFDGANSLKELDLHNWDMSKAENVDLMFWQCKNLEKLNCENWQLPKCESAELFVSHCYALSELNVKNWYAPNMRSVSKFACGCHNLKQLDLESWSCNKLEKVQGMLAGCPALKRPDFSSWGLSDYDVVRIFNDTSDNFDQMGLF